MMYGKQVLNLRLLDFRRGSLLSARSMSWDIWRSNVIKLCGGLWDCGVAFRWWMIVFQHKFCQTMSPTNNSAYSRTLFSKMAAAGDCWPYAKLTQAAFPAAARDEANKASALPPNSKLWNAMIRQNGFNILLHTWVQCNPVHSVGC